MFWRTFCARVEEEEEPHLRSSRRSFCSVDAKPCCPSNRPKAESAIREQPLSVASADLRLPSSRDVLLTL